MVVKLSDIKNASLPGVIISSLSVCSLILIISYLMFESVPQFYFCRSTFNRQSNNDAPGSAYDRM